MLSSTTGAGVNHVWEHQAGDAYLVTGRTVAGKPFQTRTKNPFHALGINLYNGRVWLVRHGCRILVKRVTP